MMKIAVFISGNGGNLQSLIDKANSPNCSYEISCVISNNPNAFGLKRAQKNNIDSIIVNHKDFKNREDFDLEIENRLKNIDFDLIVLAGFMRILFFKFIFFFNSRISLTYIFVGFSITSPIVLFPI